MKNIVLVIAILFSTTIMAQDSKPTFEKEGNLIKGTFYHEDGTVKQSGFYKNNKLHGNWKAFDINGKKIAMGKYVNGVKTGKWFFWSEDNLSEVDYINNAISSTVTWENETKLVLRN